MFYAIGYQKTEESKQKVIISISESKARKKYEKFKKMYFRVVLLKYGNTKEDYIILAQSENGKEVAAQCTIPE